MNTHETFEKLLGELFRRFGSFERNVYKKPFDGGCTYRIATKRNEYYLHVWDTGSVQASAHSRIIRPGEDWQRGNDLSGGLVSKDALNWIMWDIVAYELVPYPDDVLHPKPPKAASASEPSESVEMEAPAQ